MYSTLFDRRAAAHGLQPVSPPVYLNGGPKDFLSWVIESTTKAFTPTMCAEWLSGRMPSPVDDPASWNQNEPWSTWKPPLVQAGA